MGGYEVTAVFLPASAQIFFRNIATNIAAQEIWLVDNGRQYATSLCLYHAGT